MPDQITILKSKTRRLCKLWKADGTIGPYDNAKWFDHRQADVGNIHDLHGLLRAIEYDHNACIIRGAPKVRGEMRRLRENVEDVALHTILIEVDQYRPLLSDAVTEPVDAAHEYIVECLPDAFHGASFHWQLSNSAGAPGKEGLLKIHLWFFLAEPYDSATLKAWAKAEALQLDHSVFQPVQPHFTAAPLFEDGREDPVPVRSGLHLAARDAVDLRIDINALDIRSRESRQRGERREVEDPLADWVEANWETWGTLANGGILVSCPWEEAHSIGAPGDTSSVLFPAGTNAYAESSYVCLHNSCHDRGKSEFAKAVGYLDTRLASLAEPQPVVQHLNGHAINDPLILPPFKRNGNGGIMTTMTNLKMALDHGHVTGFDLRYDGFKDGVVCAPYASGDWRPFMDTDYTTLRIALEGRGIDGVGREMIRDAVHLVAREHAFDTARDWLDRQVWDGVERIEGFWVDHFGVLDDPYGYARAVGLYTWTALAGRVMQPGVQADMAPILTGAQGVGKSRGVMAMSPSTDFATTMSFHEPEVERARKMRGKVIVELAELQGLKSREREEILAWVTRSSEHWTPKFMEMTTTFQRRFLLVGTTNDEDFLDDPNGERRWLPMGVGRRPGFGQVDIRGIEAERAQLWAEGRDRFLSDGVLWQDAERLARGVHGAYKADDLWQHAVRRWLDAPDMAGETPRQKGHLTVHAVAEGALSMPARMVKFGDQRRISKILRDEGYESVTKRVGGRNAKVWAPLGFV